MHRRMQEELGNSSFSFSCHQLDRSVLRQHDRGHASRRYVHAERTCQWANMKVKRNLQRKQSGVGVAVGVSLSRFIYLQPLCVYEYLDPAPSFTVWSLVDRVFVMGSYAQSKS